MAYLIGVNKNFLSLVYAKIISTLLCIFPFDLSLRRQVFPVNFSFPSVVSSPRLAGLGFYCPVIVSLISNYVCIIAPYVQFHRMIACEISFLFILQAIIFIFSCLFFYNILVCYFKQIFGADILPRLSVECICRG